MARGRGRGIRGRGAIRNKGRSRRNKSVSRSPSRSPSRFRKRSKSCGAGYKKNWMGQCVRKPTKRGGGGKMPTWLKWMLAIGLLPITIFWAILKVAGAVDDPAWWIGKESFTMREGFGNNNRGRKRPKRPKGVGQSALAMLKAFFSNFFGVLTLVFISSGWMHLVYNIETYIPYPNMTDNGGLPELLRKVGQIIREKPVQSGGGIKMQKGGASPGQPRWFKKEAFFDKWAGDGAPPPEWLKKMQDGPNAMARGVGHYLQTFRDIPILLLLMEGIKLIKGFIPKKGAGASLSNLLTVAAIIPVYMVLLICLHIVFNVASSIGGIFYRQDEFSWITPAFIWPLLFPFGMIGSLIIFLLLVLMPNMERVREFFKYFYRYGSIWFIVIFAFALNDILKVFQAPGDISRWNTDQYVGIIPIIVGLSLTVIYALRQFFKYLF